MASLSRFIDPEWLQQLREVDLIGSRPISIWVDEFCFSKTDKTIKLPARGPEFSFKSDLYPEANVDIYAVKGERDDPRNPNPQAGRRNYFIIKVGERQVGAQYPSLAFAKTIAGTMHERLVTGLVADVRKRSPHYGRF